MVGRFRWGALALGAILALGACQKPAPELPKLTPLPEFQLTAQSGAPFTKAAFLGHVTVVNFIFTSCPSICPALTLRAARLQKAFAEDQGRIQLVSFSVDPEKDTPAVLTDYAKKNGADPARWTFVTGDTQAVGAAVVQGFKVEMGERAPRGDGAYDILHASHFVLVDGTATLRGFYPSDEEGMARLTADARRLSQGDSK